MATSTPVRHAWRALTGLIAVIAVLFGVNALGVHVFEKSSWTPELALDLQGGTQITLSAQTEDGANPSPEQLQQAVGIIRQRVDASGVSESEILTEGGRNIVVQVPGTIDQETSDRLEASAQMTLRPVLVASQGANTFIGEDGTETPYPWPTQSLAATPAAEPTNASDLNWVTEKLAAEFNAFDCAAPQEDPSKADPDAAMIACDADGFTKYILGPVELDGSHIDDATNGYDQQRAQWLVQLDFDDEGTKIFAEISKRLVTMTGSQRQFAFVLDGLVISAPEMQAQILDGRPSISGPTLDAEGTKALAEQLKFGALPLSFVTESNSQISATLGTQQLQIGLIAALIGLALVALYSLLSYRALGVVIIASLAVMAVITYVTLCILAWRMGFRLSLAGVAGLIVTIGFTADSFIVYFERIRDELRDGKSVTHAVEDGWDRAKRTIYISKSVNVLAAVVLYVLADSSVKGFAFTLGLTTVIDVLIFILFTHPVMQLLARTRFFGAGHPLSGMNPDALGAVYRERAQFKSLPTAAPSRGKSAKDLKSRGEAQRRQTIAERKAAEAAAARNATTTKERNED